MRFPLFHTRGLALIALLAPALLMAGCGSRKTGTVSGKVTLDGKTLPGGSVIFVVEGPKAGTQSGKIKDDGSYEVSGVPVGRATITVQGIASRRFIVPPQMQKEQGGVKEVKPEGQPQEVKVPPKYSDASKTDQHLDVKPGPQTYNIEMKSK